MLAGDDLPLPEPPGQLGQGLNITLIGYLGQLHFGLVSCRELVPDLDVLAGYLIDELALLAEAAEKRIANAQS